jgi:antitoxin MazE
MKSAIRKMGNSHGVIIPKPLLTEIGAKAGDDVDLAVKAGKLIIAPSRKPPRSGWAADSKRLAEAGDGDLAWPEFANESDRDLKW